jgi:LCP family protein required for cell wall assembly
VPPISERDRRPEPDLALATRAAGPRAPRRRPARRGRRIVGLVLVLVVALPLVTAWYLGHRLTSRIGRIDGVFAPLPAGERPARPAPGSPGAGAVNVLVLGDDPRADTLVLLHLDGRRRLAAAVSLPGSAWVTVPGAGDGTLRDAVADGPSTAVATVERLTGLRIDHLAVLDWAGISDLVDHVGGIEVVVPETMPDPDGGATWAGGSLHYLVGPAALRFVRERAGPPDDELAAIRRQQRVLGAVLRSALHQEMGEDPRMLYGFLGILADHVSVDAGWSSVDMARLGFSLRGFHSANLHFLTAPTLGTRQEGGRTVVRLDPVAGADLWHEVRVDGIDGWSAPRWAELSGDPVR